MSSPPFSGHARTDKQILARASTDTKVRQRIGFEVIHFLAAKVPSLWRRARAARARPPAVRRACCSISCSAIMACFSWLAMKAPSSAKDLWLWRGRLGDHGLDELASRAEAATFCVACFSTALAPRGLSAAKRPGHGQARLFDNCEIFAQGSDLAPRAVQISLDISWFYAGFHHASW